MAASFADAINLENVTIFILHFRIIPKLSSEPSTTPCKKMSLSSLMKSFRRKKGKSSDNDVFTGLKDEAKKGTTLYKTIQEVEKNFKDIQRIEESVFIMYSDIYGDAKTNNPGKLKSINDRLERIETFLNIGEPKSSLEELAQTSQLQTDNADGIQKNFLNSVSNLPTNEIVDIIRKDVFTELSKKLDDHSKQHKLLNEQLHSFLSDESSSQCSSRGKSSSKSSKKKKRKQRRSNNANQAQSHNSSISGMSSVSSSSNGSLASSVSNQSHSSRQMKIEENEEIAFNFRNQNKILLKLDEEVPQGADLVNEVRKKLKSLSPKSNAISDMMKNINSVNIFSSQKRDILCVKVNPTYRATLLEFIRSNRQREVKFRFMAFLHPRTRLKKKILGKIATKMCQAVPSSACIPRFTHKAQMVLQENAQADKEWKSFDQIMKNKEYTKHLTHEDIATFKDLCQQNGMTPNSLHL